MKYTSLDPSWEVYIMALHQIIWRSPDQHTFTVSGEESKPFEVRATPVIVRYYFGITVGFSHRGAEGFGTWLSSNVCDLFTAWRVAQILPRVQTMRNQGGGYDATMCGLVIAMNGDRHVDRMRERARDLGMSVPAFEAELDRLRKLLPSTNELMQMWDRLPDKQQEALVHPVTEALEEGRLHQSSLLTTRLEAASLRVRSLKEQKLHEDGLIEAGRVPAESLRQLMVDLGVSNLVYTLGFGDMFGPSHFEFDKLDREIMICLIGTRGFNQRVSLLTTPKHPDDTDARHAEGDGGITVYTTNFGEAQHPVLYISGRKYKLVHVTWSHATERYLVTIRPDELSSRDDSQDKRMSIPTLRKLIAMPVGTRAPWLPKSGRTVLRWLNK